MSIYDDSLRVKGVRYNETAYYPHNSYPKNHYKSNKIQLLLNFRIWYHFQLECKRY
jgi:hypothetical protein